jgi:ribosomal protein S18 acetylase RimI-like enzyme
MNSFFVYEMEYTGGIVETNELEMLPFRDEYYRQYEKIYNDCFYEMRKVLDIEPYNFYSDISQMIDKKDSIFLLMNDETIIGSIGCFGAEIDDLIVNKKYQGRGFGKKLLLWAVNHIREYTDEPITLTVAEWNTGALELYKSCDFTLKRKELISR